VTGLLRVRGGIAGKPGLKRNRTVDLAALPLAKDDLRDEQLFLIGVDARVEREAPGGDARSNVRTVVNVYAAVD
jgi:hypothetical protein